MSKVEVAVAIKRPNLVVISVEIEGTAPYVQNKFAAKAKAQMQAKQEAGPTSKGKKVHGAKDFEACYEGAKHKTKEGWCGIPAPAFRNAIIDACRTSGFMMTRAKMAVFIVADSFDGDDGTPLVKIVRGESKMVIHEVRNDSGVIDLRARPMWDPGWRAVVQIRFDADMLTQEDVVNLLSRAGEQVGVGEGRHFSKNSCGMGWGSFRVLAEGERK